MFVNLFGKMYKFRNGLSISKATIPEKNDGGWDIVYKTVFVVLNNKGEFANRTFATYDDAKAFVLAH